MIMNEIERATNEYLDIYQDKHAKFGRFSPILPVHIKMKLEEESKIVRQVKLSTSIYVRAAVKTYLEHIKQLYDYDDYRHFADTMQIPLQLSNECYSDIQTITNITRDKRMSSIVSRALEYSFTSEYKVI